MKKINVGSDFSGVGAFNQALNRLKIKYNEVFACDMDKYARITFIKNYGTPNYYPENVYDREIPNESLDIYMTSPPCQAFSLAGKRKGETDKRGILFYNSQEFIVKNKPRYFIFENVKGLLSDNKGTTFQTWLDMLGGKSVNGNPVIFPREDATPYHIYYKVLNALDYGVPQNRERVFIIGIRDDKDNTFTWPKEETLYKKLKDVLEKDVDDKYFLSEKLINFFIRHTERHQLKGNGFKFTTKDKSKTASSITTKSGTRPDDNYIKVKSATKKGYEIAEEGDSINLENPNSETRRGRVGKSVVNTLATSCNQAVLESIQISALRGRGENNQQTLELGSEHNSNSLTTVQKDNLIVHKKQLSSNTEDKVSTHYRIRKLTPRECFRLMDFPDTFNISEVSNTQAYKQAGNSIVVSVLEKIIAKLCFD